MAEAEAGAALVRLQDGGLGIVTDRDLRNRVVAGGVGADAPVTEAMSAPAFTITPERTGAEAMLEMLRDWFNDWATTLRTSFNVREQIVLGLTRLKRGGAEDGEGDAAGPVTPVSPAPVVAAPGTPAAGALIA